MLRFASLDELDRDGMRLRRDVHQALEAAEGTLFPDRAAAVQFLRDEGFQVVAGNQPQMITVRNMARQEANVYLTQGDGCCYLEGCDTRGIDHSVKMENYDLVYAAALSPKDEGDQRSILESLFVRFNQDRPEDFHGHSLSVSDVIVLKQRGQVTSYYTDSIGFRRLPDFLPTENALRNAEMAMEDDLNMIDGIINNGSKDEKALQAPPAPEHPPRPRHRNAPER
ncbi:MAG: DUF4316 domain-containing protein [Clostridia bacterium]|nr:DUF4316 domain-containing protein [Clostridia bacterium]MBQ9210162.1 DUF4316 domain-containing protein [Clostridia bacterium]